MKYFYLSIIAIAILLYGMFGYVIVSGIVRPSEEHLNKAKDLVKNERLVQVGFSSGSYTCINSECDYSNVVDQKQYTNFPNFSQIVTITKGYQGNWETVVSSISFNQKLQIVVLFLAFGIGGIFSVRRIKFV